MDKKKLGGAKAVGAGAAAIGATALAKVTGGLKVASLALAGLFSHGGASELATMAPVLAHSATEVTAAAPALGPSVRQVPSAATVVGRAAVQVLVRIPGQERQQLASLAGDQRDRFLILVCRQETADRSLRTFVHGAFRDWVVPTAEAFSHLGFPRGRSLLLEALSLPADSPRWEGLDREFRALPPP
jgi:hypothetical protein